LLHYRELIGWQKAMELVQAIYRETRLFPADERFGLTLQMRRCAVSVPSNIAEGQGRGTPAEFIRFLRIANGSRQELETQIILAKNLGYIDPECCEALLACSEKIGRVLSGLIRSLN
jgi:four helix bundle protein